MIDAARRASAKRIGGDSVLRLRKAGSDTDYLKLVANLLVSTGANRIMTTGSARSTDTRLF